MPNKHKPGEYVWIEKWDRMMGSHLYYTRDQQQRAAETDAPLNATHEIYDSNGRTGRWSTTDDITSVDTRHVLGLPPLPVAN